MRTYLQYIIGVLDSTEIRQVIQYECLGVITDFVEFDKEGIETLCSSVGKSKEKIPNPNATSDNAPTTIPNPGTSIPAIYEKWLIAEVYSANTYNLIG